MKLLFCGDIVGRPGRDAVLREVPQLRRQLGLDFVVANGENAAGGFGITRKICDELFAAGVDVVTGGNHIWDQREAIAFIDAEPRLIRPINFPSGTPGRGAGLYSLPNGHKILVISAMGRLFMDSLDDPFAALDAALAPYRLGASVQAIVVDFHAEATSEKMALAHFLDGRASLLVGTHTHVPTADWQIMAGGMAYQSDAGMCGNYDSVIGMDKTAPIARFTRKLPTERLSVAAGEGTLCGVYVEINSTSGRAKRISPVRIGPHLQPVLPNVVEQAEA